MKRVYQSDNHYHLVLNSSSTKAATTLGDSEGSEGEKEFKLVKKDTYLENRESIGTEDFSNLFNLIKKPNSCENDNLDVLVDQICSPEANILDEDLPEIFNNFDMSEEERQDLKLLSKSLKL